MKKLCITLGICILTTLSGTGKANNLSNEPVLMQTKSFPASEVKNVKVATSGGSVSMAGDAANTATIEMYVQANNGRHLSKDEIQQILTSDYAVSIGLVNGTMQATAKRKVSGNWKKSLSISFKVHTAKNVSGDLTTSGGSIHLSRLLGTQKFVTSGGSIHLDNLTGNLKGSTSGGSIEAANCKGNMDITTSGGSLKLSNLSGNIKMSTSGGSISAENISGNFKTATSGGSIHLVKMNCNLMASTSGGSITANIQSKDKNIELATSAGSINLTLPKDIQADLSFKANRVNPGNLSNFKGVVKKDSVNGKVNGGGAKISATTSAGSVNVSFN